jgi:hypothetical protein
MAQRLFTNVAIESTSGSFIKPDLAQMTAFAWGTFDGARIRLQFSPDGLTWFDDPTQEVVFTERTLRRVNVSVGVHVRAVLDRVGGSTNINFWVI